MEIYKGKGQENMKFKINKMVLGAVFIFCLITFFYLQYLFSYIE